MSHGLQVFKADGSLLFDSERPFWRFIESVVLTPGVSGSKNYAAVDVTAIGAFISGSAFTARGHQLSISGTTLSWIWYDVENWYVVPHDEIMVVFSR